MNQIKKKIQYKSAVGADWYTERTKVKALLSA